MKPYRPIDGLSKDEQLHNAVALVDHLRAQSARAEKVIEAAREVEMYRTFYNHGEDYDSPTRKKLRIALAEYDCPSVPERDGRPVSDPSPAPPDHPREAE